MGTPTRTGSSAGGAWWREPVAWLGAAILAASLAGCVLLIVLAERHADEALPTAGGEVFKVPLARPADPPLATGVPRDAGVPRNAADRR